MIYEVRTYRLKLRMVREFMKSFEAAYENGRKQLSPLAAFFYSEVGPLNEVIHIWPYESFEHRAQVRADGVAKGVWPPKGSPKTTSLCLPRRFRRCARTWQ